MNRIDAIIRHPKYISYYNQILELEKERLFCKHDMGHFLDVARISYIFILEDSVNISQEMIYASALLHDIGRHEQYLSGEPHEIASAKLCVDILSDTGFCEQEILDIQEAIINHRNHIINDNKNLSGYLYRGDKASRSCHSCLVKNDCDWDLNKKNMSIIR